MRPIVPSLMNYIKNFLVRLDFFRLYGLYLNPAHMPVVCGSPSAPAIWNGSLGFSVMNPEKQPKTIYQQENTHGRDLVWNQRPARN